MTKLDVLYTSDRKYLDTMLVSMYSLLKESDIESVRFHLITSRFNQEDYNRIEKLRGLYDNIDIWYYNLDNYHIERYNIPCFKESQLPNARLFFQDILGSNLLDIDKLLYLDCDTIVVSSLKEMSKYEGSILACKDTMKKRYFSSFGLENYYNSGVLLFDVQAWIKNNCQERIINFVKNSKFHLKYPDQDIINCALTDEYRELPLSYNVPSTIFVYGNIFRDLYFDTDIRNITKTDIKQARENPKILHCYGIPNVRPWNTNFHPYYGEYMKYMEEINPDFSMEELDQMMKFKVSHPNLYEMYLLLKNKDKLPHKTLKKVKKIMTNFNQK